MKADQREFTFLVRLRRHDGSAGVQWRGSVHEVASGHRRFITQIRDVADFIASYVRDERGAER
jgi:hypothetical protein